MNIVNKMLSDFKERSNSEVENTISVNDSKEKAMLKRIPWNISSTIILTAGILTLSIFIVYTTTGIPFLGLDSHITKNEPGNGVELLATTEGLLSMEGGDNREIGIDEREHQLPDEGLPPVGVGSSLPPLTKITNTISEEKPVISQASPKALLNPVAQESGKNNNPVKLAMAESAKKIKKPILPTKIDKPKEFNKTNKSEKNTKLAKTTIADKNIGKAIEQSKPNKVETVVTKNKGITNKPLESIAAKSEVPVIPKPAKKAKANSIAKKNPIKSVTKKMDDQEILAPKQKHIAVKKAIDKKNVPLTNEQIAEQKYQEAMKFVESGQTNKAIPLLETALQKHPAYLHARKALVGIHVENRSWDRAEKNLNEALVHNPHITLISTWLARIYLEMNRNSEAVKVLESRERYAKGDGEYYALLALAHQNSQSYAKAVDAYKKAIDTDNYKSRWWLGLAIVLELSEHWPDAYAAYNQSINTAQLSHDMNDYAKERLNYVRIQLELLADASD